MYMSTWWMYICSNPKWDHQKCNPDCQPGVLFPKLWPLIQSLEFLGCHWYQKPRRETLNNLKYNPQNMFLGPPGRASMVFSHNFWHRPIQPAKPCADSSPYPHGWIEILSISPIQVWESTAAHDHSRATARSVLRLLYLLIALITCTKLYQFKFWPLIQTSESLGCHCYHIPRSDWDAQQAKILAPGLSESHWHGAPWLVTQALRSSTVACHRPAGPAAGGSAPAALWRGDPADTFKLNLPHVNSGLASLAPGLWASG